MQKQTSNPKKQTRPRAPHLVVQVAPRVDRPNLSQFWRLIKIVKGKKDK